MSQTVFTGSKHLMHCFYLLRFPFLLNGAEMPHVLAFLSARDSSTSHWNQHNANVQQRAGFGDALHYALSYCDFPASVSVRQANVRYV